MKNRITEAIGWYGVAAIVVGYMSISFEIFDAQSLPYQLLNLTGAIAIMYEALKKKDYQPVVLNVIWGVVAIIALTRIVLG